MFSRRAGERPVTPDLHVGSRGLDGAGPAPWLLFWASLGCGACVRSVVVSRGLEGAPQGPRLPRKSVSVRPLDLIGSVVEVWRPLQPSTDHSVLCCVHMEKSCSALGEAAAAWLCSGLLSCVSGQLLVGFLVVGGQLTWLGGEEWDLWLGCPDRALPPGNYWQRFGEEGQLLPSGPWSQISARASVALRQSPLRGRCVARAGSFFPLISTLMTMENLLICFSFSYLARHEWFQSRLSRDILSTLFYRS